MINDKYIVLDSTPYVYELCRNITTIGKLQISHSLKIVNPGPAYHTSVNQAVYCQLNLTQNKDSKYIAL